ncbi:exo-beta-N-acetylmuramidase NamZ domain-containing protein [Flavobacterium sp. FlaQc-28]|uniref:exo-beta-N-acetylmuramidase NamZ family protein n=1 Tax=Flavobacterium sp. FlaQc-28 TaxID=3374178 RepID=UPI0037571663
MFQAFKKITFILFLIVSNASNANSSTGTIKNKINGISNEIKTGADNFEKYIPLLKDKKVGIVTNQTGLLSNKKHVVDFLLEKKINIQTIFAPEHGFRGTADAGEHIVDGKDSKTGLSIISLYGDNKKPKPEQLSGIDVMIFDLQDVGARFYTYISSLHYVMEACAENNVPLIILDRPNPNGGIVDGPLLEKEFTSFVGMHPIPLLHGMTIGEYAKMINGEKWLKNAAQCKLTVIPCVNYNRKMDYSLLAKPSPNLPNDQSINLYASLCLFEGTNVSMGRGTEKQFQIYGSPYLVKTNFSFTPKPNFGAKDPVYNGVECFGEDLTTYPKLKQLELKWLLKAYQNTSDKTKFFNPFFTKLAGTKKLQQQIESGISEDTIRKSWGKDLEAFKKMRMKYLIYQ